MNGLVYSVYNIHTQLLLDYAVLLHYVVFVNFATSASQNDVYITQEKFVIL
jgi:hypothetical protein